MSLFDKIFCGLTSNSSAITPVKAQDPDGLLPGIPAQPAAIVEVGRHAMFSQRMALQGSGDFFTLVNSHYVVYQTSRGGLWQIGHMNKKKAEAVRNHEDCPGAPRGYSDAPWPEVTDNELEAELYRDHLNSCRTTGTYTALPTHYKVPMRRRSMLSLIGFTTPDTNCNFCAKVPVETKPNNRQALLRAAILLCAGTNKLVDGLDFSDCNLSLQEFEGLTFERCLFSGADLQGAHFTDCTVRLCDFEKAKVAHLSVIGGSWNWGNHVDTLIGVQDVLMRQVRMLAGQMAEMLRVGMRVNQPILARKKKDIVVKQTPILLTPIFTTSYRMVLLDEHLTIGCQTLKIATWLTATRAELRSRNDTLKANMTKKTYAELERARPLLRQICAYHKRLPAGL